MGAEIRARNRKRLRWHWRRPRSGSWRVDETYVKVRGKWPYLYRAVDKLGNTIDFYAGIADGGGRHAAGNPFRLQVCRP
jgi:transposase-like protein